MFIDEVEIYVRSGKGGDGAVHFRREKFVPRGGPDGGDGGKGGDVILEVVPTLNTLSSFRNKEKFIARDGAPGGKQNMTGRSADDLVIPVPPGTIVTDMDSGEVIGDLTEPGQRLKVAAGGRGGRGNARFATSVHQVPRTAEKGAPGQERRLRLELRLIADVGIVGVPNAGKSTFLAAVTNAKPRVAPYPFTTLEPNLGVARLDDENSLVLADIPGLIEGAHMGVGLGHDFLRHIQRTRVLIHLLDGMAEDPLLDLAQINSELALFDPELAEKPQVVALNKIDLDDVQARWPEISAGLKEHGYEPLAISAVAGTNVRQVLYRALELLKTVPEKPRVVEAPVYRVETDPNEFTILREAGGWRVRGEAIERAASMTYWEHYQSVRRFQRILETIGVDEALRKAGVQNGDTVYIGDFELEWQD
ncbi:MAG: GTPase ObgE [Chloroflexi bacterium]|jgi:GTP-binding protein|nr:GTPase ObgE [Chloroflexota bacterium]